MLKVVIDPGHYAGYNKGVIAGYYEGNAVYKLAQYLKEELQSGTDQVEVIMTKDTMAENPGVFERGQIAARKGATVFLSLHSNAVGDAAKYEKAYGVSVYRSLFLPDSEDLGKKLADAAAAVMAPETGVTYSRGVLTRKSDSTGKDYYRVIRGAVNGAGTVAQASAGPVKHAFIIEHGFHTHSKECAFLNNDSNLQALAEAEAVVIKEHFGVIGTPNVESPTSLRLTGGSDKELWDFCKKMGLNDIAAAAVCAQSRAEGNFDSCNLQNSYEQKLGMTDAAYVAAVDSNKYTNFVHDSAGFGLFQWTFWSRKQGLYNYARKLGVSIGDFRMQCEWFWEELGQNYGSIKAALMAATDLTEISNLLTTKYERPADQSASALNKRVNYAKEYYAKFAGSVPVVSTSEKPTTPATTAPAQSITPVAAGTSVIGQIKVIYEGKDGLNIHLTPEWGNHNLNMENGPVHGGTYRVTEKVKVGSSYMYKLYSGAGYITADERYVTFTPVAVGQATERPVTQAVKAGDTVRVLKAEKYAGGSFKVWYDKYAVLKLDGDRAVIGVGGVVTAAVNVCNLEIA